tara:strand:+ start:866 stop:1762 length:897 start_codon:yes stop_codon:yes gene_type:complete
MAINFPNSPTLGDIHQIADRVWQWDGEKWKATGTTSSIFGGNVLVFEGTTDDIHETTLTVVDPTADRTITLPNATGTVVLTSDLTTYAPLASPTLTGVPAAPTASANTSTTQVATTAFVMTEVGDYAPLASPAFTGGMTITDTDSGADYGPVLDLFRNGTSMDDEDHLGTIRFTGDDTDGAKQTYGQINVRVEEDGDDAFGDMEFWIGNVGSARIQRNMVIDDYFHSISQDVRIGDGSTYTQGFGAAANERIYTGFWAELGHDGNNSLTADRTFYFPDSSGTVALADDANSIIAGQMF